MVTNLLGIQGHNTRVLFRAHIWWSGQEPMYHRLYALTGPTFYEESVRAMSLQIGSCRVIYDNHSLAILVLARTVPFSIGISVLARHATSRCDNLGRRATV